MKNKGMLVLIASFALAGPAVVFARGSEDIPVQLMQQMFKGTPLEDAIEHVPRKDRDRKGDRDRSQGRDASGRRELSDDRGGEDSYRRRGGRDRDYGGGDDRGGARSGRRESSRGPEIPGFGGSEEWWSKPGGGRGGNSYDDGGRRRDRDEDAGGGRRRDRDEDDGGGRRRRQQD